MSAKQRQIVGILGCVPAALVIVFVSKLLDASETGFYFVLALGIATYTVVVLPWMMEGQFIWQLLKKKRG